MVTIRNATLATIVFLNLILLVFLWERQAIDIPNDVPSIAKMESTRSEIISESAGTSKHGNYMVEDYREVEVWYDDQGHIIKRKPTGKHTYLRYWASDKGKIIVDDSESD